MTSPAVLRQARTCCPFRAKIVPAGQIVGAKHFSPKYEIIRNFADWRSCLKICVDRLGYVDNLNDADLLVFFKFYRDVDS
jgi:hypothetical protein